MSVDKMRRHFPTIWHFIVNNQWWKPESLSVVVVVTVFPIPLECCVAETKESCSAAPPAGEQRADRHTAGQTDRKWRVGRRRGGWRALLEMVEHVELSLIFLKRFVCIFEVLFVLMFIWRWIYFKKQMYEICSTSLAIVRNVVSDTWCDVSWEM